MDEIQVVASVGSGVIGASWATLFAQKGLRVNLYDINQPLLDQGLQSIRSNLAVLAEQGIISSSGVDAALGRVHATTDLAEAVRGAGLVQESGPDRYSIKRQIFRDLDALTGPQVILASSSSYLLMSKIQTATRHPERCVSAHPFNPPHLIPLVEIVGGEQTAPETIERLRAFMAGIGKAPVVLSKETSGYIANRLQNALVDEAFKLLAEGVGTVEDIDRACCMGPGLRWALMGPFMVANLAARGGMEEVLLGSKFSSVEDGEAGAKGPAAESPEENRALAEKCIAQLRDELAGRSSEEMGRWRDDMLLGILRMLGRL